MSPLPEPNGTNLNCSISKGSLSMSFRKSRAVVPFKRGNTSRPKYDRFGAGSGWSLSPGCSSSIELAACTNTEAEKM
jgi:hypothetical protein